MRDDLKLEPQNYKINAGINDKNAIKIREEQRLPTSLEMPVQYYSLGFDSYRGDEKMGFPINRHR
jgi:hypothetical protein